MDAIKAYQGLMGSFSPILEGDKKHKCTHVILTKDDYIDIRDENKRLREQLQEEQERLERFKSAVQEKVNEMRKNADREIEACKKVKDEALHLNENLKRICIERANADRKLRPKKRHSGYVARRSEKVTRMNGKKAEGKVWRTTIETPYKVQLTEDQARKLILEDIQEKGIFDFNGTYFTDFRMVKDIQSALWSIILETREEFNGIIEK